MYGGFEELLAPLADNLDRFGAKTEKKKSRFLQDADTQEERQELRDRLQAHVDVIGKKDVANHNQIRSAAQEKLNSNEAIVNENLSRILNEAHNLERTYRELELFFRNAAQIKAKNVTLISAHPDVLLDPNSNQVYKLIEDQITRESRSVDQKKAYSLLVIPNLWRSKEPKNLIEQYAKLANDAGISFLTDFADCDSVEDILKECEMIKWKGVVGSEPYHSKLILFANHLILRGAYEDIKEDGSLRGSPAIAVAGKMYSQKISVPIMGEKYGSITNSKGLTFRTEASDIADLGEMGLNGLVHAFEKDMVYEACTAFDGAENALRRYAVVRTFDYVNRVLRHYLGKVTNQQLDRNKVNFVLNAIVDFLNQMVEQKIISRFTVKDFEWESKIPDLIKINIEIVPLWAVRTFVFALMTKDREVSSELTGTK